jgi:hypothetical protein
MTREERNIVASTIAPDLIIKIQAISDTLAKLWVERHLEGSKNFEFVSCSDLPELCVLCIDTNEVQSTPIGGGCYILSWDKDYQILINEHLVATITCERKQLLLVAPNSGASIL